MKRVPLASILALVIFAGGIAWYLFEVPVPAPASTPAIPAPATGTPRLTLPADEANSPLLKTTPGIMRRYLNDTLKFYFTLPDGYSATDQPTNASSTKAVIVVNKSGDGFFVIAEPASGPLTADDIQANSPGETITNVQEVLVNGGLTGFMFQTDSALWKGNGVGLWFTHDGYLYEASTYAKDLPLLDFARVTWGFE